MEDDPYPEPIHLSLLGINATHDSGYTVDRRAGSDEYLFEFFDSPVVLQDERERRSYVGNVFIVYAPGQPQYFRAEGPLTHTWFQVSGEGVAECIERYQIPVNRAVETAHPDFLTPLLEEARRRIVRRQRHWEDAVTEVFRGLFRRLARSLYQDAPVELSPYQRHVLAKLHDVRAQVYRDLKRRWTVEEMAALGNMSAQRFAVAYRAGFGTGPIDDLIDVRLRHAEMLLRHLPMTVVDAAHYFGFNSVSHFHVLFRERMGRSPRQRMKVGDRSAISPIDPEYLLESSEAARRVDLLYIRPVGYWSFDQVEDAFVDDLGKHPPALLENAVSRTAGRRGGYALLFDGGSHAVVPETVIDTSRSYTVCAWLAHTRSDRMTAVSLGDAHHGAFYLQYVPSDGGFKFAVTVSERDPLAIFVASDALADVGEWHHVVGVHDRESREIRLYVDSVLIGRTRYETPWRSDGFLYFGCCKVMDTIMDSWYGAVDEVRIYDRSLSATEIEILYGGDADETGSEEGRCQDSSM